MITEAPTSLPRYLHDLTPDQTEACIDYLTRRSLSWLRHLQNILEAQIQSAYDRRLSAVVQRELRIRQAHIEEAIVRREFPE